MARVAEHYGLEWVNVVNSENPYGEIGHFLRKDGVRSNDICLRTSNSPTPRRRC